MGTPLRHRTARESPQLATTMRVGPTTATTAVDPTWSQLGFCSSHRHLGDSRGPGPLLLHAAASASIRPKLRSITSLHSAGGGPDLILSASSATISCIRSLHDTAT